MIVHMTTNDPLLASGNISETNPRSKSQGQPILILRPIVDVATFRTLKLDASAEWPQRDAATGGSLPRAARQARRREAGWLLYQTCLYAKARADAGPDGPLVSVAVTSGEPFQDSLLEVVRAALSATDLPTKRLELAFGEATLVNASGRAKGCLRELCRWGVRLAVSDFGAKYGSLSYLDDLAFASVRLHTSFTRRLTAGLRNPHYPLAVLRGLLAVAEDLDFTVVASGIRTSDDLDLLHSLGCNLQQGPFFSTAAVGERMRGEQLVGSKTGEPKSRSAN